MKKEMVSEMEDGIPIGLIVLFVLCLCGSFYCSGTEMAFASVNRIRMRSRAEAGDRQARRVLGILDDFDRALTTLLIGNNIVNITAMTVATVFATKLWGPAAVKYATVVITIVIFLLSETLPKAFAKACSEWFAMKTASSLLVLMKLLRPLSALFSSISALARRPLRGRQGAQPTVTEDELYDIIEDAVEEGALDEETGELVHSAIQYTGATVRDILTPWKDVLKLPVSTRQEQALTIIKEHTHSRIPVVGETGEVVGLLRIREYLRAVLQGGHDLSLADIAEPVHTVPDTMRLDDLLPEMSNKKTHFTVVLDQWENVLGVVTMEDILETLVGEIYDEEEEGGVRSDA